MKKIISVLTLTFLIFSCSGFGGEKIESEETQFMILQAMLMCQSKMQEEIKQATFEENYVFDNGTATMNVDFSTSSGLKIKEHTVYKVALDQWQTNVDLYLTKADMAEDKSTSCTVTLSGNVHGERSFATWAAASSDVKMEEFLFANGDSDGFAMTIYDTDAKKNIYSNSVFIRIDVKILTGMTGGKYDFFTRINGAVFDAPTQIWTEAFKP